MVKDDFVDSVVKMSTASNYPISHKQISAASFEEKTSYVWMLQNDKVYMKSKGNPNYIIISYEDLCINMRDRVEELCSFIGIVFDSQMQEFIDMISNVNTKSGYFSVIKNPTARLTKRESELDGATMEKINTLVSYSEVGRYTLEKYSAAREQMKGSVKSVL